jgi:hypothetical protein
LITLQETINRVVDAAYQNEAAGQLYAELSKNPGLSEFGEILPGSPSPQNSAANLVTYTDEYGQKITMEIRDQLLYDVLTTSPASAHGIARALGTVTRAMASLTTANNPIFSAKNLMRDFQHSVNYGSWASNYVTGTIKWLASAADIVADRAGMETRGTETLHQYYNLGGGGYNRMTNLREERGAVSTVRNVLHSYQRGNTLDGIARFYEGFKSFVTAEDLNDIIETTSRYAEYKFGKHDLTTAEGREEAFLAAQEATVNFAEKGMSQLAADLRAVIPFWNATLQGTAQLADMFSRAERPRLAARLGKFVFNNVLTGALGFLALTRLGDDDDWDWFLKLPNSVRYTNIILPFTDSEAHARRFIRLPLSQDPLTKLFYQVGFTAVANGTGSQFELDLAEFARATWENSLQTDTVINPLLSILSNKNYYGGQLVSGKLLEKPVTEQFNETTPEVFKWLSRELHNRGTDISPIVLQYITQQYTGFFGQVAIPFLSPDALNNYELNPLENVLRTVRNSVTIDPAYTNDINDAYYDGLTRLKQIAAAEGSSDLLSTNLTPERVQEAKDIAAQMTGTYGVLTQFSDQLAELRRQQKALLSRTDMTSYQKEYQRRKLQEQQVELQEEALKYINDYTEEFVSGTDPAKFVIYGGPAVEAASANAKLPSAVLADQYKGKPYAKAIEEYSRAREDNKLPSSINTTFYDEDGKKYTLRYSRLDDGQYAGDYYGERFAAACDEYWAEIGGEWANMDAAEQEKALKAMFKSANAAAKEDLENALGMDLSLTKPKD